MSTKTESKANPVKEMFDQAMRNYEDALKSGLKVQEEAMKGWAQVLNGSLAGADGRQRAKAVADELIPRVEKALDLGLKQFEKNGRANIELLKQAVDLSQAATWSEAQRRYLGMWESSIHSMREAAESVTQAQAQAFESWMTIATRAAGTKA